jgi:hypothetical protein
VTVAVVEEVALDGVDEEFELDDDAAEVVVESWSLPIEVEVLFARCESPQAPSIIDPAATNTTTRRIVPG